MDPRRQLALGHALDEDAFGERVDRPEHAPILAAAEEFDRLLVVELGIRREEPVVRRSGAKRRGQALERGDDLEQPLASFGARLDLVAKPACDRPRIRTEEPRDVSALELERNRSLLETLRGHHLF